MEISEFTLKIILILTPGFLSSLIYEKITVHSKWTSFTFFKYSTFFGGISYLVTQSILGGIWGDWSMGLFWENIDQKGIPFSVIGKSTITSFFIGFFASWVENRKYINRLGEKLKISNKYGDENLYYYFLNNKSVTEIYLRDLRTGITYHGNVDSFNETEQNNEILLNQVTAYSSDTSEELYQMSKVYLCIPKDQTLLEFPNIINKSNNEKGSTESKSPKASPKN